MMRLAILGLLVLQQGCAMLPPRGEITPSMAISASAATDLGRIAQDSMAQAPGSVAPASAVSGFRPLPLSAWSMDARLTLARMAQQSLDLQYYHLESDLVGHTLLRAVRDAAQRGVRVRLLVDDLYTASSEPMLLGLAAYPQVEVRLFNPFPSGRGSASTRWAASLFDFARVNHRMHNKMFIADGAFAVAGGRNIADEYFFSSKDGNFVDFDLLVAGPAVSNLAAIFDRYWNSPRVYPLQAVASADGNTTALQARFEALTADAANAFPPLVADRKDILGYTAVSTDIRKSPLKLLFGNIEVFADDPEKVSGKAEAGTDESTVTARVLKAMREANQDLLIGSPYFIPGEPGVDAIRIARAKQVSVMVMTNSLASNDEPLASAAYGRYRARLLRLGAQLYETDSRLLRNDALIADALGNSIGRSHSKLIVFDKRVTFVGSMNMDLRSSRVNTELGMLVSSPELAAIIHKLADRVRGGSYQVRLAGTGDDLLWVLKKNGVETVYDSEPDVSAWLRFKVTVLLPLVSEGLL
jgi:putative cardiolipin synthase